MEEELNQSKPEERKPNKPKIAVIAVHGVADQSAHDSARAIASLLLNHDQNENDKQVQYTPFCESTLRIAVRPADMDGCAGWRSRHHTAHRKAGGGSGAVAERGQGGR